MMKTLTEKQKKLLYRILAAIVLMILLSILPLKQYPAVRFLLFLVPYFTVGFDILRKAFKGIRNRQVFDENFLMAVATIGAMVLGEYTEGVAVMLFYQIGELFQSIAVGKSRRNISELMDIRPDYANLVTEDGVEKVDPDDVETGSILLIQPGERVPIDGVVVEGSSSLDTSALTGESLPRDISEGDEILSGSINQSGVLRIQTTREFEESTASRILDLVENAGSRKAKSEQFIHQICPVVYTGCLLQRSRAGSAGARREHGFPAQERRMGIVVQMDLPRADISRHQLPLRHCGQHPPDFFWRDRRSRQQGDFDQGCQFHGDTGGCTHSCL